MIEHCAAGCFIPAIHIHSQGRRHFTFRLHVVHTSPESLVLKRPTGNKFSTMRSGDTGYSQTQLGIYCLVFPVSIPVKQHRQIRRINANVCPQSKPTGEGIDCSRFILTQRSTLRYLSCSCPSQHTPWNHHPRRLRE